jgi:glycerophosphoryl diester phosphodiesterase
MAEYSNHLNLFKPGTDDNMGVEETLDGNFQKIDEKLGDSLTDKDNKQYATLGTRLNEQQAKVDTAVTDSAAAMAREYNVVRDDLVHHTIALRGYGMGVPENTYSSLMLAKQAGYWGIKTELRLTSDRKWICFTDDTVDRVSNGTGTVASKTLAQMKALDTSSKVGGAYRAEERVLTLEEFLWFCRESNLTAYLELKVVLTATDAAALIKAITDNSMARRSAIISSNIPDLKMIRDLDRNLQVGYSTSVLNQTNINYALEVENSFLYALWTQVTTANYRLALASGIQVDAWSPSKFADVQTAIKNGARRVITNANPF